MQGNSSPPYIIPNNDVFKFRFDDNSSQRISWSAFSSSNMAAGRLLHLHRNIRSLCSGVRSLPRGKLQRHHCRVGYPHNRELINTLILYLLSRSRHSSVIIVNRQVARQQGKYYCIPYSNNRIFSSRNVQTGFGVPLAFCVAGTVAVYAEIMRQEREAKHSLPCHAELSGPHFADPGGRAV